MANLPFGVSRLDRIIGGGVPPGNVVLLVGESGAGAREFLYTSAAMNALGHADDDLFDLHYGGLEGDTSLPDEVHYISFTAGAGSIEREMTYTMADEIVEAAVSEITFKDFSPEYFQLSPIPRDWYMGEMTTLQDLGEQHNRDGVMSALGDYLTANAAGNLVLIDSITDLVGAVNDELAWNEIAMLMRGLMKASHQWGGLIVVLANQETLAPTELGHLMDAASGTLQFEWESGGSQRARTMVVRAFRGVLARLESENIVRFETEIHEGGLDVSDVRKIR
ncbi:RecA-superfamily ATPase, KaiC/GvpD/RAD55 family [Halogranum gelatinilyticum]|uniref:RecA-superfamily ATPase, KaiC/GvpD/RAD55 family n=1 Tax=Halogranum gelatinilyticum TaxID=660521 RepID=A0A1G9U8U1_9EURY|nr:HTR-like protein [Halogranum gelatinilyticum]SDM56298.1 RecA-superfamily ATPase, KaiC/GvpD/RAD55 family [Halogranum gelatinilyticum]